MEKAALRDNFCGCAPQLQLLIARSCRIDKKAMMEVLHREHAFSDMFVAYLLTRNIRYEEDLVDQLFNSSEKRLARILLLLAQFGKEGKHEVAVPNLSQETLAEMVAQRARELASS